MPGTPGLVAYYNSFHRLAGWGNLVLFEDERTKDAWGSDPRHAAAVARSPRHYHSIRLHNARVVDGLMGSGDLELIRTRYLDFGRAAAWRAMQAPDEAGAPFGERVELVEAAHEPVEPRIVERRDRPRDVQLGDVPVAVPIPRVPPSRPRWDTRHLASVAWIE